MKLLVALALIGLVAGGPVEFPSPMGFDYHEEIGIPLAARIKAAEEAMDFDGARIVGGSAASLGQFPFLGGIVINLTSGASSLCTCSLLSNTRIVTAAHCWRHLNSQASLFTIVLGSLFLYSGGTRIPTTNIEMHANYNMMTLNNDIAIGIISPVTFGNLISPISIDTSNSNHVGTFATAAGFGVTNTGSITINQFLSFVTVPVITNAQCAFTYGTSTVVDSTICIATTGGRGTCGGDSGGPLVANNVLIGVTSFGHAMGCLAEQPAGFVRVASLAPWIQARI